MGNKRNFAVPVLTVAAETTRNEYAKKVEPICKADTQANEKTLRHVKQWAKHGKLKPASLAFTKALKTTHAELEAIPQPDADQSTRTKWLGKIKAEIGYFEAVAKKLKQGNKNAAEEMVVNSLITSNWQNDTVFGFYRHYFKANTARFT